MNRTIVKSLNTFPLINLTSIISITPGLNAFKGARIVFTISTNAFSLSVAGVIPSIELVTSLILFKLFLNNLNRTIVKSLNTFPLINLTSTISITPGLNAFKGARIVLAIFTNAFTSFVAGVIPSISAVIFVI